MALLRDLLLWLLISGHVIGAATVFRKYFPRESPWFGFIVPSLALVMLLNFIEHFVALPSLLWLLPVTSLGLVYLISRRGFSWEGMTIPSVAFLLAFAFTYAVRCYSPDILTSSDGMYDLSLVLDYCHGEKIPPTDNWLPTLDLKLYYSFQQYGASVVKRLFNVDVGTAYNASHALLSAFTAFCGAAVAFRASGERGWIALTVVFLIEAAFTGSSAFVNLFLPEGHTSFVSNNLGGSLNNEGIGDSPLLKFIGWGTHHERLELQVSGYWTWRDEYHANSSGHFFTLFSVFSVLELTRRERANWPWICAMLIVPLVFVSTMWLAPVDGIICSVGLVLALLLGRRPVHWTVVAYGITAGIIALWPTLADILTAQQVDENSWNNFVTKPELRTPIAEWCVQWWPIVFLWIATLCFWKQLSAGVRWICFAIPFFLIGIELFTFDNDRYNTLEKMWGCIYGAGLVTFFGVVASRRGVICRILTGLIIVCAVISMYGWIHNLGRSPGLFDLQGNSGLRSDVQKRKILETLEQLRGATLLAGHCEYNYTEAPAATVFTGNRCYIASFFGEERFGHKTQADARTILNNDFYAGKMTDPLGFLNSNNIDGVIIWPGDNIPDLLIQRLKGELAPTYEYEDCRGDWSTNAGVFLRRPLPIIKR